MPAEGVAQHRIRSGHVGRAAGGGAALHHGAEGGGTAGNAFIQRAEVYSRLVFEVGFPPVILHRIRGILPCLSCFFCSFLGGFGGLVGFLLE